MLSPGIVVEHGVSCGTRPWSTRGGRGKLSRHALDDRHEGGAKSGARGAVRLSRVVPRLLVSALHLRSTPRAFARRRPGPKAFSCTYWNTGRLPALTGSKVYSGRFCRPLFRITSRMRSTMPAASKEEETGNRASGCRRGRRTLSTRARRVSDSRKNLRCPVGNDGPGRSAEATPPEVCHRGKNIHIRSAKSFLDPNSSLAPPSYDEVANRLKVTTGAVKTLIHWLRKRYTASLRQEVGRRVSDPAEIDEEIHALCEALIATEGRLGP